MTRWTAIARSIGWRLALVTASIAVALVIAEIAARLLVPPEVDEFFTPFVHDDRSYRYDLKDPTILRTLAWYKPGATGVTGDAPVRINNLGLRDARDYPAVKPADCFRVLGLGDSMTFGKGVAEEETFLGTLETKLGMRFPNRCIEVLNAGQPNTNFHTQWLHYKLAWHTLKPDLVVVGFFVYNDSQLEGEEEPYSLRWMEFIDANPWMKGSRLVRMLYHRAFFGMGAKALEEGLPRYFADDYPGWEQFRNAVGDFKKLATTQGARIAFTLIPVPEGYDNYPYRKYHERVTQFLVGEHQIPTFDLLNGLGGIKARKHWVHPSDGHPDAFVHEQMAEYMAEAMPWADWLDEAASP